MLSQLRWIGLDSDQKNYLVGFTPYDDSLRGESPLLNIKLKATPLMVPPTKREHMTFGVKNYDYKPQHESAIVYSEAFKVHYGEVRIAIPAQALLQACPQKSASLELQTDIEVEWKSKVQGRLKVEKDWLKISKPSVLDLQQKFPRLDENSVIKPPDSVHVFKALKSLPKEQQNKVVSKVGLMILGLIASSFFILYQCANVLNDPASNSGSAELTGLLVLFVLVGGFYVLPRMLKAVSKESFESYLDLSQTVPRTIGKNEEVKLGDLFEASSEIKLEGLKIRLIALQDQRFVYRIVTQPQGYSYSSSSNDPTVLASASLIGDVAIKEIFEHDDLVNSFQTENGSTCHDYLYTIDKTFCVIFQKDLPTIEAGVPIQSVCQDILNLDEFFASMYPAAMVNPHCGLSLQWQLQFIHPTFKDIDFPLNQLSFNPVDFFALET